MPHVSSAVAQLLSVRHRGHAMRMFMHTCKIVPGVGSSLQSIVSSGRAVVWVHTDSPDRVDDLCQEHLFKKGWMIEEHHETHEVTEASVAHNHLSAAMFQKAVKFGVASEIAASKRG